MKIRCEYTRLVPLHELKPNPLNKKLKKHTPEAIERTAKVLEYQGWRRPITVSNQSGFISVGHKRFYAAKLRKWEVVPVSFQDYDDETQENADLVSDNALNEWDTLDLGGVNEIVPDMGPDFDLDLLGIKGFELDASDKFHGDEDAVPEVPPEPKVKRGELWLMGAYYECDCGETHDL